MKLEQIIKFDNSIADLIQEEGELESEVCDADTYQTMLEQQVAILTEFMKRANQPPVEACPTQPDGVIPTLASAQGTTTTISPSTEITADTLPETEVIKKLIPTGSDISRVSDATPHDIPARTSRDMHMSYSRLPKLHLPTFDGNPLQWQTFWASFSAAVDSNPCLTGVQKFNYLRTQLKGLHPVLLVASHCLTPIKLTQ